ncbi:MAG: T9SS type A sorting domain-containing protein, partial [Cyclobacteriaceae bacterium]|nr:T9SS type A sorting domain-containing protein [Cyclobacteriaceae bacterium]
WLLPEEASILSDEGDRVRLTFEKEGTYELGVKTALGKCTDTSMKSIRIVAPDKNIPGGRMDKTGIKDFQLFPNPNTGEFSLEVSLYQPGDVTIQVIQLSQGRILYQDEGMNADFHPFHVQLKHLPAGVYAVKISSGNDHQGTRFVLR